MQAVMDDSPQRKHPKAQHDYLSWLHKTSPSPSRPEARGENTPEWSHNYHRTVGSSSCTPSSSPVETPRNEIEIDKNEETSGLQMEDLVSALRRMASGLRDTDDRQELDQTVKPEMLTPRPHPHPFSKDASGITDPEAVISLVEMGRNDRSPNYSSRMMQALSCIEGLSVGSPSGGPSPCKEGANDQDHMHTRRPHRDLHEEGKRWRLNKQRWIALEKKRKEMLEESKLEEACSFHPQLSAYAKKMRRPPSLRPECRASSEVLQRRKWQAAKRQEKIQEELRECTFHPLTLHAIDILHRSPGKEKEVFNKLFEDAVHRHHFNSCVKATVISELEKYTNSLEGAQNVVVPPEEVQTIVERLFSKAAVVAATKSAAAEVSAPTHTPRLSQKTQEIIKEKERSGERSPDPTRRLYQSGGGLESSRGLQQRMGQVLEEALGREAEKSAKQKRQEIEAKLQSQRINGILAEKFRLLARHVAKSSHAVYQRHAKQSSSALAHAAVALLPADESTEVLTGLERCRLNELSETDFVQAMRRQVQAGASGGGGGKNPLLTPPPHHTRRSLSPPSEEEAGAPRPLPRVRREKADPQVIAAAREKREAFLRQMEEEATKRREGEGYVPFHSRLIPYACRSDAAPTVKKTRASALRQECVQKKIAAETAKELYPVVTPHVSEILTRALFASAEEQPAAISHDHTKNRSREDITSRDSTAVIPAAGPPSFSAPQRHGNVEEGLTDIPSALQPAFRPHSGRERDAAQPLARRSSDSESRSSTPPSSIHKGSGLERNNSNSDEAAWRHSLLSAAGADFKADAAGAALNVGKDLLIKQLREYQRRRNYK